VLAEYHCRYDLKERKVKDVQDTVIYETRFASEIGALVPWRGQEWLVVDRLRRARQRTWPPFPLCGYRYLSWEALNKPAQFPKYIEEIVARMPYRCAVSVRAETLVPVGYTPDLGPDTRRPCQHWWATPPGGETGAGQAGGDEWGRRSGWAKTPLSRCHRSVLTGSGPHHFLTCRRPSPAQTPRSTPAP